MSRRLGILLDLTCGVCRSPFNDYRRTRWCSKECRAAEKATRRGTTTAAITKSAEISLARIKLMVLEFNDAYPDQALRIIAA